MDANPIGCTASAAATRATTNRLGARLRDVRVFRVGMEVKSAVNEWKKAQKRQIRRC
jgi:hypothetical protein